LNTIAALLQGSVGLSLRRQLCSIAGETAGLAGWLAWDLEDRRAAGAYFRAGIEAAQEAEDRPLGAYLVGSSCVQPAYRNGRTPASGASRGGPPASPLLMPTRRRAPGWSPWRPRRMPGRQRGGQPADA
jgi:hypothetical protein